jgi:hypothetical protein
MSIKEMKNLLDKLGVKRDDCFEKQDLIDRIKESKNKKGGASNTRQSSFGAGQQRGTSKPKEDYSQYDNINPSQYKMPKPV